MIACRHWFLHLDTIAQSVCSTHQIQNLNFIFKEHKSSLEKGMSVTVQGGLFKVKTRYCVLLQMGVES